MQTSPCGKTCLINKTFVKRNNKAENSKVRLILWTPPPYINITDLSPGFCSLRGHHPTQTRTRGMASGPNLDSHPRTVQE